MNRRLIACRAKRVMFQVVYPKQWDELHVCSQNKSHRSCHGQNMPALLTVFYKLMFFPLKIIKNKVIWPRQSEGYTLIGSKFSQEVCAIAPMIPLKDVQGLFPNSWLFSRWTLQEKIPLCSGSCCQDLVCIRHAPRHWATVPSSFLPSFFLFTFEADSR